MRERWPYTKSTCRGGTRRLYRFSDLPEDIQTVLLNAKNPPAVPLSPVPLTLVPPLESAPELDYDAEELWRWAGSRTQKLRDQGTQRAHVIRHVEQVMEDGTSFRSASRLVAEVEGVNPATIRNWYYGRDGRPGARHYRPQDRAAALVPGWQGRRPRVEIPAEAWQWFISYYLTRRRPTLAAAYRRTVETATAQGWGQLPSAKTFSRRLKSDTSLAARIYHREGPAAVAKLFPPQWRDKRALRAGQAASGDGLKFDRVYVRWPDGEVLNTSTGWFWAAVRTGFIAAWRIAKTENTDLFRLATYDLTGLFKPDVVWVDNTMVAANKAMTGRAPNRHRGKDKADDPIGLLLQLGIEVRFPNPSKVMGSPGAKPIERSFGIGGIHEKVATHPKFLNRGYSKKTAIPYEEFVAVVAVVAEEVARFNTQPKRRTAVCRGVLSYQQAFEESFSSSVATKLTEAQRGLLLRVPEVCRADRSRGEIRLKAGRGPMGQHRYWSEELTEYKGHQIVAYYDPEALSSPITVTTLDGRTICHAQHLEDVGFADTSAGREWSKQKSRWVKATRKAAEAESRMNELEVAAQYPEAEAAEIPEPGVVGGQFGQRRQVVNGEIVEASGRSFQEMSPPLRAVNETTEHEDLVSHGEELILRMGQQMFTRKKEEEERISRSDEQILRMGKHMIGRKKEEIW